jgi:hypothetical protein
MKSLFAIFFILFHVGLVFGTDYAKIDKQSASVPKNLKTAEEIAGYLTRNLTTPAEKSRAIYFWISNNIRYDMSLVYSNKSVSSTQELVDEALKTRKGVCANYAELFKACCASVGVKSYVITGYTMQYGELAKISHAWNAVLINGKYYMIDATWASGREENGKYVHEFYDQYFLIPPAEFIKTHMPYDPIWQFLDNPLTNKEFEKSDFKKLKIPSNFNYADSIKKHMQLSPLDMLIHENRRISKFGITNNLIREKVSVNQHNIAVDKYNNAVVLLNKAVVDFNIYVMAKNKQFRGTAMPDEEILELLASARKNMESAEKVLKSLNSDDAGLNRLIRDTEAPIQNLKENLREEDAFVKKYIKTVKPLRIFLFVQLKKDKH